MNSENTVIIKSSEFLRNCFLNAAISHLKFMKTLRKLISNYFPNYLI